MGDSSRRLEHKPELGRHLLCPRPKNSFRGEPVKTIVDLDSREPRGIKAQHLLGREALRIKLATPFFVAEAAGADPEPHVYSSFLR